MKYLLTTCIGLLCTLSGFSQQIEKIFYNPKDTTSDYYLAVKPMSGKIKGVLVLLRGFRQPEAMLAETNLPNVAASNDILSILVSVDQKLFADAATIEKLNYVLTHVIHKYAADTSRFALAGYDFAGTIALRYAELASEGKNGIPVIPKAVFAADCPVDLYNVWRRSENQVKKNFYPGSVGDAKYYLGRMKSEIGDIKNSIDNYRNLSPIYIDSTGPGNEQLLKHMGVRLYYDLDIGWQLKSRRNSFDDTNIPDGSEFIKRLMLQGNENAQFIAARPGMRVNGVPNPSSFSIIEETDCIRWVKKSLGIFDPVFWERPYRISIPKNWSNEIIGFPIEFASSIPYQGVEDLFFAPGFTDNKSAEYWSYFYCWWLNGKVSPDENTIKNNLKVYYEGLVGSNVVSRKISTSLNTPVEVTITKDQTGQLFKGKIKMLDYMSSQPIVLNFSVQIRHCIEEGKTALLVEISPKPINAPVWKQMQLISRSFQCRQ